MDQPSFDIAVVGAGAAGLATGIFAARRASGASIALLDGARTLGAKILVSGGGRCNVTNREVGERDFNGGSRHVVRRVLRALPVADTVGVFAELGVRLHEEEDGKLFPDTNRARTVLDALVGGCRARGVRILAGHRVTAIDPAGSGFRIETGVGRVTARRVVLATGGLSLPKSGSDGAGYGLARRLGHTVVPTTPALVPLVLETGGHTALSGVSQPVELSLAVEGSRPRRAAGALLWTHFGVSGPAVLDVSRHLLRARLEARRADLVANLVPGLEFAAADAWLVTLAHDRPRAQLANGLAERLPAAVARAICASLGLDGSLPAARLTRDERRRLAHALTAWPLPVRDSRGYAFAEVTAGGVSLSEIDARTMASRVCPGLFLVGELLDVDGRLGGFNFQWAWASAKAAAGGLAATLA